MTHRHKIFGKGFENQPPKTSSLPHPSWKPARTVLVRAVSFGFRRNPVYESFEVHCCPVYVFWSSLLFGKVLFVSAKLPPDSNRCLRTHLDTALYINKRGKKNSANYTQTLHFSIYSSDSPYVTKCIVCIQNYTQTIHWTIHWGVQNPTQNGAQFYLGAHLSKIWGRQIKIWGRERKIWGRERKIWGRQILTGCAPSFFLGALLVFS